MATQLTIVNNILRRLREETVATVNESAYSTLIAMFVNDAKEDMEDMGHLWSTYRTTIDTSILNDGTTQYDLTGTNERSFLLRRFEQPTLPMAIDITSGEPGQLWEIPYSELLAVRNLDTNPTQTDTTPRNFSVYPTSTGFGMELLWGSSESRTWRTWWYVPQDPLDVSGGTDDATLVQLPRRPVELRALYYALEERGEVMGPRSGSNAWMRSENAIASAIEIDQQVNKDWQEKIFTNEENL